MPPAEPAVAVTLLGGVAVRRGGESVRLASTRAVALLAYLAVTAPAAQPRQHLAAVFWPDTPDPQARTNLRRELHHLRQLVPAACLDITDTAIGWRDDDACAVDVRTFLRYHVDARAVPRGAPSTVLVERALQAIGAYAGSFLPGLYDDWALEARESLRRSCVALCDDVVAELADREPRVSLELARRRIALEPLEEVGYRQLMRLQVDGKDRSGALTTYHRCASVLEEQLGVAPTAETFALLSTIIDLTAGLGADRVLPALPPARGAASEQSLVGRGPDLAVMLDRWREACDGRSGVLLLTGDPGVGKSRLLAELGRTVSREGSAVATARCFSSSGVALSPVADWLRSPDVTSSRRSLDSVWQTEVERLVPRTGSDTGLDAGRNGHDPVSTSRALVDSWQRHRFYEGLSHAVLSVDRPLLLCLDDLHWCDQETLAYVTFLLRMAHGAPLLMVATARSDELDQRRELRDGVNDLRSASLLTERHLEPLPLAATTELAARMFGRSVAPSDAALLQAASGGYPLYVVEAARAANETGEAGGGGDGSAVSEAGLGGVLRRRLTELSPQARRCAALAAAVGRDFRLDLLVEASDEDEMTVVRAVDELWRRHLLHQVGRGYDFSHDLLRDEAYALVDPAQRWLEHRRLASALELLHADDLDAVAVSLAEQHERGGRPEAAVPFYFRAAAMAAGVFANAEALRLFDHCVSILSELPAGADRDQRELEVLQEMSPPMTALHGYADRGLQRTFERSVELAESLGRVDLEVASLVGLWATTFVQGDILGSHAIATRALDLSKLVPTLENQARFGLGGSALTLGQPTVAVHELDLASEMSLGAVSLNVGSRPEVHARAWSAHAWWLLGDQERAMAACSEAVARAREAHHPYSLAIACAYAAVTAQLRNDLALLDESVAELTALCDRHTFAYYREWALILGGWRLGTRNGVAQIKVGIANLSTSGSFARMPYWLALLADTQRSVGEREAGDATLDAAWSAAVQRGDRWWLPEVIRARAMSRPPDAALPLLLKAETMARDQSSLTLAARCRADLDHRGLAAVASRTGESHGG